MWNWKDAEAFINQAATKGSVLGLENIQNLMGELDNVQDKLKLIHVAGTNGKGSTSAVLEQILREAGYRTGRYSSPAVFCPEEKYQINGNYINKEEFHSVLEKVAEACSRMTEKGMEHPTLFEIETAVAFLWFYQQQCQIVILETGLGGTMDATNVIRNPVCSVITSVSMDHMGFLGDTLEQIAGEKAGIIKEGCPVITAMQQPQVYKVLEQVCQEKQTRLIKSNGELIENIHYEGEYLVFDWMEYKALKLALLGGYQPENAACALQTIKCLEEQGFQIQEQNIREGLMKVLWPGRFEVIHKAPMVVLDGAHNEDAAKKLKKTLEMGFTKCKIIYIIGVLADKEYEKILQQMLPLAEQVYTVTPDNPRALSGEKLCREAMKYHKQVRCAASVQEAVRLAFDKAAELRKENVEREAEEKEPMILAFGSLSYLGEVKDIISNK